MITGEPKDDIVIVLRRVETQLRVGYVINPDLVVRAADEIERLREELAEAQRIARQWRDVVAVNIRK
jgi:hypothetical protein